MPLQPRRESDMWDSDVIIPVLIVIVFTYILRQGFKHGWGGGGGWGDSGGG